MKHGLLMIDDVPLVLGMRLPRKYELTAMKASIDAANNEMVRTGPVMWVPSVYDGAQEQDLKHEASPTFGAEDGLRARLGFMGTSRDDLGDPGDSDEDEEEGEDEDEDEDEDGPVYRGETVSGLRMLQQAAESAQKDMVQQVAAYADRLAQSNRLAQLMPGAQCFDQTKPPEEAEIRSYYRRCAQHRVRDSERKAFEARLALRDKARGVLTGEWL